MGGSSELVEFVHILRTSELMKALQRNQTKVCVGLEALIPDADTEVKKSSRKSTEEHRTVTGWSCRYCLPHVEKLSQYYSLQEANHGMVHMDFFSDQVITVHVNGCKFGWNASSCVACKCKHTSCGQNQSEKCWIRIIISVGDSLII